MTGDGVENDLKIVLKCAQTQRAETHYVKKHLPVYWPSIFTDSCIIGKISRYCYENINSDIALTKSYKLKGHELDLEWSQFVADSFSRQCDLRS